MASGTAYAKRYPGGFADGPGGGTGIDSAFLNAVETALLQLLSAAPTADGQVAQWDNANTRFGPALILNKNVDPAAAIARSKLDFGSGLVNADVAAAAAIALSKLADPGSGKVIGSVGAGAVATVPSMQTIFDVVVGRGGTTNPYLGGSMIDPAGPAATLDTNTILGGNIPATYKHLMMILSGRGDTAAANINFSLKINNDGTAGNYPASQYSLANGAAITAGTAASSTAGAFAGGINAASATAGYPGIAQILLSDYLGTTFNKTFLTQSGDPNSNLTYYVNGAWASTVAVTRLALACVAGNFIAGTRWTLYGLN